MKSNQPVLASQEPGRKYEQVVKTLKPYDSIKEEDPEARAAGRALVEQGKVAGPKRKAFVFVNNRLEGNAISTIAAMMQGWYASQANC